MNKLASRNLNIELIRIVAMLLIVLGHIVGYYVPISTEASPLLKTCCSAICFFIPFHVNLFILISGYCGIKRWSNIIKIWGLLLSTQLCITGITYIFNLDVHYTWQTYVFPLTHNDWWFMRIYIMLCVLAPAIERFINYSRQQEVYSILIALLCLDIYFSFIHRVQTINYDGYNLLHFLTIYLIGCFLRNNLSKICRKQKLLMLAIISIALLKVVWHLILNYYNIDDRYTDYNNPFNIISSVLIFGFMMNLNCHSKWITIISSSVISAYLISEAPPIKTWIVNICTDYIDSIDSFPQELLFIGLLWIVIFIVSIIIDKIRLIIFSPIIQGITKLSEKILHVNHS